MEQNLNDKPLSNMQIARYIESLRKEMNFDDEVYGLVKSDLEDGLTQEQTEKYLDKNFNIGQMRVLSEGLHKEIPEELFNFIGKTASGALLNEKGPRGGGHENGTVVKLEDIKTFCSPIVIIVIEFM